MFEVADVHTYVRVVAGVAVVAVAVAVEGSRLHYGATAATIAASAATWAAWTAATAIILGRRRRRWWLNDDSRWPRRWRNLYHLYSSCVVLHVASFD